MLGDLLEKLAFGQFLFNSLELDDCLLAVENLVVGFRVEGLGFRL